MRKAIILPMSLNAFQAISLPPILITLPPSRYSDILASEALSVITPCAILLLPPRPILIPPSPNSDILASRVLLLAPCAILLPPSPNSDILASRALCHQQKNKKYDSNNERNLWPWIKNKSNLEPSHKHGHIQKPSTCYRPHVARTAKENKPLHLDSCNKWQDNKQRQKVCCLSQEKKDEIVWANTDTDHTHTQQSVISLKRQRQTIQHNCSKLENSAR